MKTKIFALATAITCQSFACTVSAKASSEAPTKTAATITFVRPLKNEVFNDQPIYSQVLVSNFNLVAPTLAPGGADGKSGHIDYTLDDFPVCSTKAIQLMFGKNLGRRYLPVGRHVLRAELKDCNNNSLNPPVVTDVSLWTRHPAGRESNRAAVGAESGELTSEELLAVRQYLEQAQFELSKIQNGGFQPRADNATPNGVE